MLSEKRAVGGDDDDDWEREMGEIRLDQGVS